MWENLGGLNTIDESLGGYASFIARFEISTVPTLNMFMVPSLNREYKKSSSILECCNQPTKPSSGLFL